MGPVVEVILATVDLVKAEFDVARVGAARAVTALSLILAAAFFLVIALGLGLAACWLALYDWLDQAAAASLLTGALAVLVALGLFALARSRLGTRP